MAEKVDSNSSLRPMLWTTLKEGYTFQKFLADLGAGIIVGILALPLAIAFGIASGVKPEQGLFTAVVAGFLISALGGSRVQIGGPTGAFIVIVYGIVEKYGYEGLVFATFIAGILLILMGLAKLGAVIQFIPYPVTVGFTSGIAVLIASSQVRDFLGLKMASVPADFIDKIEAYSQNIHSYNIFAVVIATLTILLIVYWPRLTKRVPGPLVAIILATLAAYYFNLPVETIGSRFGEVPNVLPSPHVPKLSWTMIKAMISPAFTIALLAGIESLLSAVVADGMLSTRHRSNMELVANGVANIGSAIFGGIPATGAIARTATNVKNGGRTPVAGMIHAVVLLLIMMAFGKLAGLIPICALAGILLVVSYNMSEWHLFVGLFKSPKSDVVVLLATFFLTVLVDLTVALQVGVVLATFLFMRRMAETAQVGFLKDGMSSALPGEDPSPIAKDKIPQGVEIFEVFGALFFGAANKFKDALIHFDKPPKVLIVRLREVHVIDATGLQVIKDIFSRTKQAGTVLLLSGVHSQPLVAMERSGLLYEVGEDNVLGNMEDALARASEVLEKGK